MPISNQIGASRLIQPGVVDSAATRPASPYEGQCIFQKDTDQLLVWNGTAWVIPNAPAQNPDGLELITTATCSSGGTAVGGVTTIGSAVTNVVIANAFSSIYDNYKIVISGMAASSAGNSCYLLLSGSTGATYYWAGNYQAYSSGTSVSIGAANGSSGIWAGITGGITSCVLDLINPYKTSVTNMTNAYSNNTWCGLTAGQDNNTVSHTGFTFSHVGGPTMTGGTIRVYGYRN